MLKARITNFSQYIPKLKNAHRVCTVTTLDRHLNISTYTTDTKIIQTAMGNYVKLRMSVV